MTIFWWIFIIYSVLAVVGIWRAIYLSGHKHHKDTIIDRLLITGAIPIAYLLSIITRLIVRKDE